jgi:thiol-disulfide isomerase/thioredoxin
MAGRISKTRLAVMVVLIIAVGAIVGIALSCDSCSEPEPTLLIVAWNETSLSELEGTPVVLNFWSISCVYCVQQLPYLESAAQENEGELEVIAINIADSASRIQTFFGDYDPTMTIAVDTNREAFREYCLAYNNTRGAIPFTLFVDAEGMVRYTRIGAFTSKETLWDALGDVFGITIP